MRIIEFLDCYSFQTERGVYIKDNKNTFEVDLGYGVSVSFQRVRRNRKGCEYNYKLLEVNYSKRYYSALDAADAWYDHEYRCYDSKKLDRKIPPCDDIADIGDGEYVCACWRQTRCFRSIREQLAMLENEISPAEIYAQELSDASEIQD